MKYTERTIRLYRKVNPKETMEERHLTVMEGLSKLDAPLGLKNSEIPETPDFGVDITTFFYTKNILTKGVKINGSYGWRAEELNNWDDLFYKFKTTYKLIDYKKIINIDLPKVIEIYEPYIMDIFISAKYDIAFEEGRTPETITYGRSESKNSNYLKLKKQGVKVDTLEENLFTLQPAMYFSGEMCKKVLKLERDNIIKRLKGKAQKVIPLLDGVYIIFSDKVDLSYEEFKEINDNFKPMLGLI